MVWITKHIYIDVDTEKSTEKLDKNIEITILRTVKEKYITIPRTSGIETHTHFYRKNKYRQTRMPYKTERHERTL